MGKPLCLDELEMDIGLILSRRWVGVSNSSVAVVHIAVRYVNTTPHRHFVALATRVPATCAASAV